MDENGYRLATAIVAIILLQAAVITIKKIRKKRRFKTRPIYKDRKKNGFFAATFLKMKANDHGQFFKYTRMTPVVYEKFLELIKGDLKKRYARDQISPEEKVAMTLNYLSQGSSLQNIAWAYKMGVTSVQTSVHHVCRIIWERLAPIHLAPPTMDEWKNIAKDYYQLLNFPNCIGALDGKHVNIQAPPRSGSEFFNYKKLFSVVLMAVCDAKYIFRLVDIGANGSQSDGGIFRCSNFGTRLEQGSLNIPGDSLLPNSNMILPHAIVADEAFPLKRYILRPYPGANLTLQQRVFNYRLSRARRCIENSFGIMAARWRIMRTEINDKVKNVDNIIIAVVVLHNYCKMEMTNANVYCPPGYVDTGDNQDGQWLQEVTQALISVGRLAANNASRLCYKIRDLYRDYFFSPRGSVPWQIEAVTRRN